jgi:hypothetical protein
VAGVKNGAFPFKLPKNDQKRQKTEHPHPHLICKTLKDKEKRSMSVHCFDVFKIGA